MSDSEIFQTSLAELHGITNRESGIAMAEHARVGLGNFISASLPSSFDFDVPLMTLMLLLNRAQSFHEGALDAVRRDNPFAAFTLLRSYAENAAVLVRILDNPTDFRRLYPGAARESKLRIGQITGAASTRFGEFKNIYDQLSKHAHPDPATAFAGWAGGEGDELSWSSVPHFKTEDDAMMACVWLIELAQANGQLWRECYEMLFGNHATVIPSLWEGKRADL